MLNTRCASTSREKKNQTIHISQCGTRSPGWPQRSCTSCSIIHLSAYVAFSSASTKANWGWHTGLLLCTAFKWCRMWDKLQPSGGYFYISESEPLYLMDSEGSSFQSLVKAAMPSQRITCSVTAADTPPVVGLGAEGQQSIRDKILSPSPLPGSMMSIITSGHALPASLSLTF